MVKLGTIIIYWLLKDKLVIFIYVKLFFSLSRLFETQEGAGVHIKVHCGPSIEWPCYRVKNNESDIYKEEKIMVFK